MSNAPRPLSPTCKALLLCDDTILEAGTGKITLVGIFRRFVVRQFPGRTRPFSAFMQITNAQGVYDMLVTIEDLQTGDIVAEATGPGIEIRDRLSVSNVIIPAPALPLEHSGAYDFVIFANGDEIDRQQFMAISLEELEQ